MKRSSKQLVETLITIGLPVRKSFGRREVCKILGISPRTFWRLVSPNQVEGNQKALDSFILQGERRIAFDALAAYLERNGTFKRLSWDENPNRKINLQNRQRRK